MKLGFGRILDATPGENDADGDEPTRRHVPVRRAGGLARVVPPSLVAAHEEGHAVLQRAEEGAEEIRRAARAEAASLRARAAEEGHAEAAATFAARSLLLAEKERALEERAMDRLVDLARLLAERLLGETLKLDPSRVASLARQALTEAQGARLIEIGAHPDDVPILEKELELAGAEKTARIVPDPARKRGSLRFDTDLGSLDAELGPQLDRLAKTLRASLTHG